MERLILCGGPFKYEGAKTLDANPDYKPDYCVLLPPLPRELRDGRWNEIYLIHGIEHFYLWEARELITEIHQALAPCGLLVMEQPNLEIAAKAMLGLIPPMTEKVESSGIYAIFGDPTLENPMMCHKWGWTPEALRTMTIECGFAPENIKIGRALSRNKFAEGRDFRLEATK